jgi:hypothetical protein
MLRSDQIPTTGRKPTYQAKQLGFDSVVDFAASLPQEATVADVGAGLSRLGHEVLAIRPDVRWINIDPCYDDSVIRAEIGTKSPDNIEYFPEDIVQGSPRLTSLKGKIDLVYSYWMLPHLSEESDEPARAACGHMYDLLKPSGKLIVGPIKRPGFGLLSPYRYKGVKQYTKKQPKNDVITDVVATTKLWWLPRRIQLFSNRHNVHILALVLGGKHKTIKRKSV